MHLRVLFLLLILFLISACVMAVILNPKFEKNRKTKLFYFDPNLKVETMVFQLGCNKSHC